MKTKIFVLFALFLIALIAYSFWCNCWLLEGTSKTETQTGLTTVNTPQDRVETVDEYRVDQSDFIEPTVLFTNDTPADTVLTAAELSGIVLMREEEKLARDVYTALGAEWQLPIFSNIAASEQTHFNAMAELLARYELEDPATGRAPGEFQSPELAALYEELMAIGRQSELDALIVGATIEDLDIFDLEQLMSETDRADITVTYQNLQKGSRNHLRAFVRQIERRGTTYTPQYISAATFDSIVNSSQERGMIR